MIIDIAKEYKTLDLKEACLFEPQLDYAYF